MECGRGPGIYAGPSLCQGICIFMWNTGEPRRERDRKKEKKEKGREEEREEESAESEREALSCEREGRGQREEPMASQGVLPFRYEGASR